MFKLKYKYYCAIGKKNTAFDQMYAKNIKFDCNLSKTVAFLLSTEIYTV